MGAGLQWSVERRKLFAASVSDTGWVEGRGCGYDVRLQDSQGRVVVSGGEQRPTGSGIKTEQKRKKAGRGKLQRADRVERGREEEEKD